MSKHSCRVQKKHRVVIQVTKEVSSLIFNWFFYPYWFVLHHHWLVLWCFVFRTGNGLFKPFLFLVVRDILMVHVAFIFIIPGCHRWLFFVLTNCGFLFFNVIIILGLNNFMKLLFEIWWHLVNTVHERFSEHSGNLIKPSLPVLEPKYRHPVISVASVNAQLPIFIASVLNVG